MNNTTFTTYRLPLESVVTKKKYQVRLLGINPDVVDDYTRAIEGGDQFPPLTVFKVGEEYLLVDGFHRHAAYTKAGATTVECEVIEGTEQEAHDFAQFQANRKNGQRLSRQDLRAVVVRLVTQDEHKSTPNTTLAQLAGVSHSTVQRVREELGLKPNFVVTAAGVERRTPDQQPLEWHEGEPPHGPEYPEQSGFPALTQKVALRLADRLADIENSLDKLEPLTDYLSTEEAQLLIGLGERVVSLAEGVVA